MMFFNNLPRYSIISVILLKYACGQSTNDHQGSFTNTYGRISNIDNQHIYVSSSLSVSNCIRQCVEFPINHYEYTFEDCFAYNYYIKNYTCELIHSIKPLEYVISFQTQWMTGLKNSP